MKRIIYPILGSFLLTIVLVWWMKFTGTYHVHDAFHFWALFFLSWILGILITLGLTYVLARLLKLHARAWTSQDIRAIVFIISFVSFFVSLVVFEVIGGFLSRTLFGNQLTGVRMHITDAYGMLIVVCVLGGIFYLLYRIAEQARYQRIDFKGAKIERKQRFFLVLKLVLSGALVTYIAGLVSESDVSHLVQRGLIDRKWNTERSELVRTLTVKNPGLGHRAYLEVMVKICNKLDEAGAKVVVVPLPSNLSYSESLARLVEQIAKSGHVVFAVSPQRKTDEDEFVVSPPMENKVPMNWGVVSIEQFPETWWKSYKYYPLKYHEGTTGRQVLDVGVQAVRRYLGETTNVEPSLNNGKFVLGEYHTGVLEDQGVLILHRIWTGVPYQFYATADEQTGAVEYAVGGDEALFRSNLSDSLWHKLAGGKIILVDSWDPSQNLTYFTWTYGNIIHDVLHNLGTTPLDSWTPFIIVLVLVVIAGLMVTLKPWMSLVAVVILTISQGFVAVWLASSAGVVIEFPTTMAGTLLGFFVFSYVFIAHERKQFERFEKKRMSEELKTAHDMQMGLLPAEDPKIPGYEISGISKPADEVGGDFFDYVWLDEKKTRLGIAIGDVSGKAMKAAITAVLTSGMVYREVGTNETPKSILRKINRPMYLKTERRMFTAMTFGVVDIRKKILTFSNAGQMQPMLKRGGKTEMLNVTGVRFPLGMMEDAEYREVAVPLKRNDVIVFYTDGIPEAMNAKNEMFGFDRLEIIVKESPADLSARQLASNISDKVVEFAGSAKQHDDMTVVVLKVGD